MMQGHTGETIIGVLITAFFTLLRRKVTRIERVLGKINQITESTK